MKRFIGKKVWFTGEVGAYDEKMNKICIINPDTTIGEVVKDHFWTDYDEQRMRNLKTGMKISFTAMITEYIGLENDKYVTKIGIGKLRNIKEL